MESAEEKYADIINMKHHISTKYPHMSLENRAAQFAPFAALTGYEDKVIETARLTNKRIELDEEEKTILDSKLQIVLGQIDLKQIVTFTYFIPDNKKDGGEYVTISGIIKKIKESEGLILLEDNTLIPILEIIDIKASLLNTYELN